MDLFPRSTRADLLALLREGHVLTTAEISERLDVSKRHVRRLINEQLRPAGYSIQGRRRGREKEFFLPSSEWQTATVELDLTEREALALVIAAAASRSGDSPAPLEEALRSALDRIVHGLPGKVDTFEPELLMDHLHFGEAASVDVDPEVFVELVEAIGNRRTVCIDYHKASNDTYQEGRTIQPWALARRGDAWLCVARDPAKEAMRDFNLSRMDDVRPADASSPGADYTIADDFDLELYFIDRFEALDDEEIYRVRLLVEPDRVPYFESKTYHRTQQIHDGGRDDDRIIVSYEVAGLKEIAAFVRSWGPGVTVLDPPELAERIASEAATVAARYESDS